MIDLHVSRVYDTGGGGTHPAIWERPAVWHPGTSTPTGAPTEITCPPEQQAPLAPGTVLTAFGPNDQKYPKPRATDDEADTDS